MADSPLNQIDATERVRSITPGDLPDRLRRRYLAERKGPSSFRYFVDATATAPAFKDEGRRLSAERNDPHVIRDLVAIARHRGWAAIEVRGQTDFRREAWLAARAAGLQVHGYRPTERDAQALERRTDRPREASGDPPRTQGPLARGGPSPQARLRVVEAVVRHRIVEPAVQDRVLAAARTRLAQLLHRDEPHRRAARERSR